jgi:hypothetical protein
MGHRAGIQSEVKRHKPLFVDSKYLEKQYEEVKQWYESDAYKQMMEKVATRPFYTK